MKKLISFILALTTVFSLTACGCDHQWQDATCTTPKTCSKCGETEGEAAGHTPGDLVVAAVDTDTLTMTQERSCTICDEVLETASSATGIAPVNSVIHLSPNEWHDCLLTTIRNYGAGQSLYDYPVESDDSALLHSVVSMSQMNTVFSFQDLDGNVISTDADELRCNIHNIRMDSQFTNDNAQEFFMLLMLVLLNNNSALDPADASTMASQIMQGIPVADNGFTYAMEIISVENHTVCVSITAE